MKNKYTKAYAMEQDLVCVSTEEFNARIGYFMDKWEIINMVLGASKGSFIRKIAENHYILFSESHYHYYPLHIICPLYANKDAKEWWKELKLLFKEYK